MTKEHLRVAIISHHFPPNYTAGAEQYAYRLADGLIKLGHHVEVVCIESIEKGTLIPTCVSENYQGIPVHRLYFNLALAPNTLEIFYRNPYLGQWFSDFLSRMKPNLVHFNGGYLIGGSVFDAAFNQNLPSVLTLHDYWFLCPFHTLIRSNNEICDKPCPPGQCRWCYLTRFRRYRLPDQLLHGTVGDAFVNLSTNKLSSRLRKMKRGIHILEDRREYLKSVLSKVDVVISPSHFLIDKFREYHFDTDRITYLPFGLDTKNLIPEDDPTSSDELRIGYMGQFAHHKGIHVLVEAFKKLETSGRKCKLILYGKLSGDHGYAGLIRRAIHGREDIHYAGPYDNGQVGKILRGLDLVVVPSIWYENRPTIIVEALAMKVPVVASRIGGIVELIEHEKNGLLYDTGNVDDLKRQLQRFIDDPALQPKLRNGIQPVITIGEEMAVLVNLYQSLIGRSVNETQ